MQQIKAWATNLFRPVGRNTTTSAPNQKTDVESMKEIVELAEQFDEVIDRPGYRKILEFMAKEVTQAISDATTYMYEPDRARIQVCIWNAKRDLLDSAMAYVQGIRNSRDEIVSQFKQRNGGMNGGSGN